MDGPATSEGANAMARAFSAIAPSELDGTIMTGGPNWLAERVCDFLAGRVRRVIERSGPQSATVTPPASAPIASGYVPPDLETMTRAQLEAIAPALRQLGQAADARYKRVVEHLGNLEAVG